MLPSCRIFSSRVRLHSALIRKRNFLTNVYNCTDAWNSRTSSPILSKVNLNDFYIALDQTFNSKGLISAIDVDIFANALKDSTYLDELRDLLLKLRRSADTGNTLESTHYATIRNYIDFGETEDLVEILKDPLSYGIFLDDFTSNMLLNMLLKSEKYEQAASIAAICMLQEDYSNVITTALCQYASYKFISGYIPIENIPPEPKKKIEEVKIRIKFLRNPYNDDHFDLKDPLLLAGKTLAWMSKQKSDNLSMNLQILGWAYYRKYDELTKCCENAVKNESFKVYAEVEELLQKECSKGPESESEPLLESCCKLLHKCKKAETSLEESLKTSIENAINQKQNQDIATQLKVFQSWAEIRETKLNEQIKRLDRAKRIQLLQEKQEKMKVEEQKLWFFENEDKIDLEIEEKEKLEDKTVARKKGALDKHDDDYIPPEILPKKK